MIEEYKSRINRVFDYIERNLDTRFSLEKLAAVANFSKFHFHRIFFSMTGETPFQFISRVRIEKAAVLLINNHRKTITEIAQECGFYDSSIFARNFKNYFNMSATQWRKKQKKSNISQIQGNNRQDIIRSSNYNKSIEFKSVTGGQNGLKGNVIIKELPVMHVAYVRYIGPFEGDAELFSALFGKLISWAEPRGLMKQPGMKSIVMVHDVPGITRDDKLRVSVCISVPPKTKVDGEVGKMDIPGGLYAVAGFKLGDDEFQKAWTWLYGTWLPGSGYQPDNKPCFEMYSEKPEEGKTPVEICIPIIPL